MSQTSGSNKLVLVSLLASAGMILFVFESFLPVLPWFRPGFGNVATILALFMFGFRDAMKVTFLRVILGALILGRLFTPVFVFALTGGVVSTIVMAVTARLRPGTFGTVGISVMGAVSHNIVQLLVAYLFFIKSAEIFIFIPIFILTGVVTGNVTGLVAAMMMEKWPGRYTKTNKRRA